MSDKAAVQHDVASTPGAERDTLPMLERVFLREQIEAALADDEEAPSHALRGTEFEDDDDRETEPSVDTLLLRDAFLAVGNNHGQ